MPEPKKKGRAQLLGGPKLKLFEGLGLWGGVTCRDTDGDGRSSPEQLGSLEAARPTFGAQAFSVVPMDESKREIGEWIWGAKEG